MFSLPEKYKVGKKIPMKDFILKELKPDVRKTMKDNVKSVVLSYQLAGEEIPSVVNGEQNCQVIQFYEFELADIKKATLIAGLYQEIIKSACVLRFYDTVSEVYSFSLKRLNQNDKTQIVVTDKLITTSYSANLPSADKNTLLHEIAFENIKNRSNKAAYYTELYVRAYILSNSKVYADAKDFLHKPIWYSGSKVKEVYALLCKLKAVKEKVQVTTSNAEKMQLNQEIRAIIEMLHNM